MWKESHKWGFHATGGLQTPLITFAKHFCITFCLSSAGKKRTPKKKYLFSHHTLVRGFFFYPWSLKALTKFLLPKSERSIFKKMSKEVSAHLQSLTVAVVPSAWGEKNITLTDNVKEKKQQNLPGVDVNRKRLLVPLNRASFSHSPPFVVKLTRNFYKINYYANVETTKKNLSNSSQRKNFSLVRNICRFFGWKMRREGRYRKIRCYD